MRDWHPIFRVFPCTMNNAHHVDDEELKKEVFHVANVLLRSRELAGLMQDASQADVAGDMPLEEDYHVTDTYDLDSVYMHLLLESSRNCISAGPLLIIPDYQAKGPHVELNYRKPVQVVLFPYPDEKGPGYNVVCTCDHGGSSYFLRDIPKGVSVNDARVREVVDASVESFAGELVEGMKRCSHVKYVWYTKVTLFY